MMDELISDFWVWAETSPELYAKMQTSLEEFMYPRWKEIIEKAKNIVLMEDMTTSGMDNFLTVLAIDNEREEILDFLSEISMSNAFFSQLIEAGMHHLQPHARWQIAVLLGRKRPKGYQDFLCALSQDENVYVCKRAKNELLG